MSIFRNYKTVLGELDKMENCDEYQYQNSLNIFSLTLGPFEKESKEIKQGDQDKIDMQLAIDNLDDSQDNDAPAKDSNDQFLRFINEDLALKIEIFKLREKGDIEPIWKLHEWLEYNKMRTSQLIKNIIRKKYSNSSQEQYIVIMLERILEEFAEPHYGYLRINISLSRMHLDNGNLNVDKDIKFYFWINVFGVCNTSLV